MCVDADFDGLKDLIIHETDLISEGKIHLYLQTSPFEFEKKSTKIILSIHDFFLF